jgi:FkbM family methyltransferase
MFVKKAIRTLQSELWFLKEPKDLVYLWSRRLLRIPHEADFHALRLIRQQFDGSFVDIGGNQGQSIESIRLIVPDARIVSFEPNPALNRRLAARYGGDHRITIRSLGLGAQAGTLTLHVPSYRGFVYDGLSSLDREAARTWINQDTVFFFRPGSLTIETFDCPIETLDAQHLDPLFIKIDVQGTEYDVVRGGLETIRRYEPVLLVEDYHSDPRLVALMTELGYGAYAFDGTGFVAGPSHGPNSFLLTKSRFAALQAQGA